MARWETEADGLGKQGDSLCLIVEKGTNEDSILAGGLPAHLAEALVAKHNRDKGAAADDRWYTLMGQALQGLLANPDQGNEHTLAHEVELAARAADMAMEYAESRDVTNLHLID